MSGTEFKLNDKALHGLAGDFVRAVNPHSEAAPAALLFQFLAAYGCLIGRNSYCTVEATKHYPNLFVTVVGRSSKGRKGTSWSHVKHLFKLVDETSIEACEFTGMSSGEGLIASVSDVPNDDSYETAKPIPGWSKDKRRLVVESEFGGTLRILAREGNTLSAILRKAWDDGSLQVMTRREPLSARDAHISVIGHITVDELSKYLSDVEVFNGLGNRFLWVYTSRSKLLPFGGNSSEALSGLVQPTRDALNFGAIAREVTFSADSRQLWAKIYEQLSIEKAGLVGSITARSEPIVLRLALLYCLLDRSNHIEPVHLRAALAAWIYCEQTCSIVFGQCSPKTDSEKLLHALETSDPLTRTDIFRGVFKNNKKSEALDRLLDDLIIRGEIALIEGKPPRYQRKISEPKLSELLQ